MARPALVVVGSSNTDMVVKLGRLPSPGETVLGGDFVTAGGGKGANQAVAARRLNADVTFVARVGADALGSAALDFLRAEGVDTSCISCDPDAPSGVALIYVDDDGENMIAVAPGANARLDSSDVQRAASAISGARVLIAQLEVPIATVTSAFRLARATGVTTLLNPAPVPRDGLPHSLVSLVDLINPNRGELARLTGMGASTTDEATLAAQKLLALGVRGVVVTLGSDGALVVDSAGAEHVAAFRVRAVDATGAGDAFTAGLAVAIAEGRDLRSAARYGNAVAALATTRIGAQPSMPARSDVDRLLQSA